jgi:nicotinate phosphoribosyltransferase
MPNGSSLALLTDLYQLTMAHAYWREGVAEREAVFHLSFRENPFGAGFSIACGLERVMEFIDAFRFESSDLEYLARVPAADGSRLFEDDFLGVLGGMRFACDVDAVPEGTAVFPHEPLLRVTGPLLQAQLLETPLLNLVNFSTLIATKAARVCLAAGDDPVLEFGLRRAQGVDGALTASRAAYVGGCAATSNALAGKLYDIPVRGTHAHSFVMLFDDEEAAFDAFARAQPANCTFLVDTYDTLQGVRRAVEAARRLRSRGHEMLGVRLDSGDLGRLARETRRILDASGFPETAIVASNDLDEYAIERLKREGAPISIWGVGTRLATGHGQSALGGVYKLGALRRGEGEGEGDWEYVIKRSEDPAKASLPGVQQVRRFGDDDRFERDVIYDLATGLDEPGQSDLLVPVYRAGKRVREAPALRAVRERTAAQLRSLGPEITRLDDPRRYPVSLSPALARLRQTLLERA